MTAIPVGSRVRPSQSRVERKRQEMITYTGGPLRRSAEAAFEQERDKRGTVIAHLPKPAHSVVIVPKGEVHGYRVQWDGGGISECLSYVVEPCQ